MKSILITVIILFIGCAGTSNNHPECDLLEFKKELITEGMFIIDSLVEKTKKDSIEIKQLKELLKECQESKTIKREPKSF